MAREKTVVTIRIPEETKAEIQKEADALNISFNAMVNLIICRGLDKIKSGHSLT